MSVTEHIRSTDRFVYVLDHDAGLRRVLSEPDRSRCRQHAVAAIAELPVGRWDPRARPIPEAELGLLVLDGLMIRDVTVGEARTGELIGPGSILRPWDDTGTEAPMRHEIGWQVVEPTRLAVLDQHFLRVVAHWPALITALVARTMERTHALSEMVSIHSIKRVDVRLLAFFWHLADRFGKVTADGVLVPLALTHRQLALLVGAQRPSVTSALGVLAEQGLLRRDDDGHWLLESEPGEDPAEALQQRNGARAS
jgi:CRP/FNR family transcriptional regulator, cyclic AMP receptor protein